mgnify:CR=1 FL=1
MQKISKLAKFYPTFILGYSLLPLMASAQINRALDKVGGTLNNIVGLLFIVATIVFLWGVIQFIAKAGDEAGRAKAKGIMTWGIVGLAVMVAAWGIVSLLVQYFTIPGEGIPTGPRQPGGGGGGTST